MNPLDTGDVFCMSLMNPNPTAGRNKSGQWYRISFELSHEEWQQFQDANNLAGLVIEVDEARAIVAEGVEPGVDDDRKVVLGGGDGLITEKSKPLKGPYGQEARSLVLSGFFYDPVIQSLACLSKNGGLFAIRFSEYCQFKFNTLLL